MRVCDGMHQRGLKSETEQAAQSKLGAAAGLTIALHALVRPVAAMAYEPICAHQACLQW